MWVELVFMMLILKLPAIYLGAVCWYAVRAEPRPLEGAATYAAAGPETPPRRHGGRGRLPRTPHGGPRRTYTRVVRPLGARAELSR